MHIVALVTRKGGAGKSTLAANLAVAAHLAGERVFICDLDPLQSLVKWSRLRKAVDVPVEHIPGRKLGRALAALEESGVTWAVIDTPGADAACCAEAIDAADFCIIPSRPNVLDLWASEETLGRIKAAGKDFAFLLNQCPPGRQNARAARGAEALLEMGALLRPMISTRVDYQEAVAKGLGVNEWRPASVAAAEISQLWVELKGRLELIALERRSTRGPANPVLASYREFFDQAARISDLYGDFLKTFLPADVPPSAPTPAEAEDAEAPERRRGA